MALPEQIRKQSEDVKELYRQLNGDDNTGEPTPANGTVASETTTEEQETQQASDENTAANEAAPPSANEPKTGGDNVPEENIVQRYRTLQGMYNAEVPRLRQQVQHMEQLLASISTQQQNAPKQPPQRQVEKLVTEKEVEEYGDSLDVMRKVSREELIPVAQRLAQIEGMLRQMQMNVVPQVQAVAQHQQMSREQQFWAELATAVPNFRDINGEEEFQSWLLEQDPLTNITRQTYLEDAQRALDARRVAHFFRTWLEITGQANGAQSTGRSSSAATPSSELEKQLTPGRSRGTGTPANPNKGKTYTPQDIQKFYDDVRTGKYKGREQERSRIERDIFTAQREGRVAINA